MFNKKNLTITIILIVILALVGGGVFWYMNKGNEEVIVIEDDKVEEIIQKDPVEDITIEAEEIDTSDWQIYRNEEYGFEVKYPKGWVFENFNNGVGFGTIQSKSGGYTWGIYIYNENNKDELIKKQGSQFTDRLEKREKIMTNEVEGILVTITTPSHSTWISKSIFITQNNKIYKIGNGAREDERFKYFYNSFKFTN